MKGPTVGKLEELYEPARGQDGDVVSTTVVAGVDGGADDTAYPRRKLFTYGAGHATCAYLGHLKGYRYIHSAVRDPEIRRTVLEAMAEGQRGLAAAYGSPAAAPSCTGSWRASTTPPSTTRSPASRAIPCASWALRTALSGRGGWPHEPA